MGQFEIPQATTLAAFRAARAAGITTLLNPAPAAPIDPELLALSDWLAPNEMEFTTLFGGSAIGDGADERILAAAAKSGVNLLVTLGGHGAAIAQRGQPIQRVSAPKVTVVDTTGTQFTDGANAELKIAAGVATATSVLNWGTASIDVVAAKGAAKFTSLNLKGKTVTVTDGKKKYTYKPSSAKASNTIKLAKGSHKLVIKGGSVSKTVTITVP